MRIGIATDYLEKKLLDIVKLQASQINGCAYCVDTHWKDLRAEGHLPDELYEHVRRQFSEKELVNLTLAVVAINGWNRLCISFRKVAGTYQPPAAGPVKKDTV